MPHPNEQRVCLYLWTDGGVVFAGCGPEGACLALADRMEEHQVARGQVVPCDGTHDVVWRQPQYEVLAEALARQEGRDPRPYTDLVLGGTR